MYFFINAQIFTINCNSNLFLMKIFSRKTCFRTIYIVKGFNAMKKIKLKINELLVPKQNCIIIPGKGYLITNLIIDADDITKIVNNPQSDNQVNQSPTKNKHKPDKRKKKKKRKKGMTEKRVQEMIDKSIAKNNVYLLSEMDKQIDKKIETNNRVLIRAVRNIIDEALAPINEKLDKIIKLNNLKTE